ncbi:MAG TPA: TonB-dependent receptor [Rhizomicrobium sp.]|nr:TonB-dependent receptor [Rhizomicrobium sp.]
MENFGKKLMLGGSVVALLATTAAVAQAQDANNVESVVVSSSRISIQGYEAPTPVTVIGAAQLQRDAHVSIGDSIRELPSVGSSDSPSNGSHSGNAAQGDAGIDTVNLRNLGVIRTLVLFDNQRVVSSNPQAGEGGVDLGTIPQTLISRVDVVTGGASAAWGSDALAGVVNLVLNKTFTGVKGSFTYGNTTRMDHQSYKAEVTAGTEFAGGRAHLIGALTYTMSPDTIFATQRGWFYNQKVLFQGPAGGPARITVLNPGANNFTQGGLITGSTAGAGVVGVGGVTALAAKDALKNIQFVGSSATPAPFNPGTASNFSAYCISCSASVLTSTPNDNMIAVPYHNVTLFGYGSYKLTDNITASLQVNYGQNAEQNYSNAGVRGNQTINSGNPFIPASVQAQMTAGGIPAITVANDTMNNRDLSNITMASLYNVYGQGYVMNYRQFARAVATLEGSLNLLGEDWTWNAYYQHGQIRERQWLPYQTEKARYQNALNAVTVTAANVGASGLPLGSIACKSTLATPADGCVPIDIFGIGNVSRDAMNYLAPGRLSRAREDTVLFLLNQDVASVSSQGVLPWGLPAGKIAVSLGGEYRLEQQRQTADPAGIGAAGGYISGNFVSWAGQYNVEEGFMEFDVPLLKDQFVQSLSFNAAGRYTSYSTSGAVQTWKLGITGQIIDDLRIRATMSSDIRAPNQGELFAPQNFSTSTFTDRLHNNAPVSLTFAQGGNPLLIPEQANTISGGVVLTPSFIENLSLSVDYYSISIHNAIRSGGFGTQPTIDLCASTGIAAYCNNVYIATAVSGGFATAMVSASGQPYTGPLFSANQAGLVNFVRSTALNGQGEYTSGIDFQGDYRHELFDGSMDWHLVGNYTDQKTNTLLNVTYATIGQLNGSEGVTAGGADGAKFHMTLAASYGEGPYEFTVQGRYIGTARLVNVWVPGVDVDNNSVPDVAYMDIRASYRLNDRIQFFGAIDNAFNTPPPWIATTGGINNGSGPALTRYDGVGRSFRVGIRLDD